MRPFSGVSSQPSNPGRDRAPPGPPPNRPVQRSDDNSDYRSSLSSDSDYIYPTERPRWEPGRLRERFHEWLHYMIKRVVLNEPGSRSQHRRFKRERNRRWVRQDRRRAERERRRRRRQREKDKAREKRRRERARKRREEKRETGERDTRDRVKSWRTSVEGGPPAPDPRTDSKEGGSKAPRQQSRSNKGNKKSENSKEAASPPPSKARKGSKNDSLSGKKETKTTPPPKSGRRKGSHPRNSRLSEEKRNKRTAHASGLLKNKPPSPKDNSSHPNDISPPGWGEHSPRHTEADTTQHKNYDSTDSFHSKESHSGRTKMDNSPETANSSVLGLTSGDSGSGRTERGTSLQGTAGGSLSRLGEENGVTSTEVSSIPEPPGGWRDLPVVRTRGPKGSTG